MAGCTEYPLGISATFKRKPGEGVGHDLTNHTSLSSRFIAYSGSIRKEIPLGCRSRPQTMCRVPKSTNRVPLGTPGHVCLVCPKPTLPGATW